MGERVILVLSEEDSIGARVILARMDESDAAEKMIESLVNYSDCDGSGGPIDWTDLDPKSVVEVALDGLV